MTIGRNVNRPRIARFGPTNIHAIRGTPNTRWSARIGGSSAFIAAAASVAGRASNEFLVKLTIEAAQTRALHYFPAALTCSSMSALIRFSASSSDISPTIA